MRFVCTTLPGVSQIGMDILPFRLVEDSARGEEEASPGRAGLDPLLNIDFHLFGRANLEQVRRHIAANTCPIPKFLLCFRHLSLVKDPPGLSGGRTGIDDNLEAPVVATFNEHEGNNAFLSHLLNFWLRVG
jgi:hypothetical protein